MTDDRQTPQGDQLPDWLKGRIHEQPGETPARPEPPGPSPADLPDQDELDFLRDVGGVPPGGVREESSSRLPGAAVDDADLWARDDTVEEPEAITLRGMTGELPWLDDVVHDKAPAAQEPADDDIGGIPAGLFEDEPSGFEDAALPADSGRLRGLTGALPWLDDQSPGEEQPPEDAGEMPEPDWLDQAPTPPSFDEDDEELAVPELEPEPSAEEAEDLPDWLDQADEAFEEPEAQPGEELPDWLDSMGALDDEDIEAALEPGEAVPDWLAASDEPESEEAPDEQPDEEPVASEAAAESVPDWLSEADELEEEPADFDFEEEEEPVLEEAAAAPDWLDAEAVDLPDEILHEDEEEELTYDEWQEQQEEAVREPSEEELLADEVPDWFDAIEEPGEAGPVPAEAAPVDEGEPEFVPDWFLGLEEQDTSEAPDWFSKIEFSADAMTAQPVIPEAPAEPVQPAEVPAAAEQEAPDWLTDIEEPAPAAEAPAVPADEVPDWFADMAGEPPAVEAPVAPAAPAEEVPDWMAEIEETPPPTGEPPVVPAAPAEEVPDWMAEIEEAPPPVVEPTTEPIATGADLEPGEAPDWLDDLAPDLAGAPPEEVLKPDDILEGGEDFMSVIDVELAEDGLLARRAQEAELLAAAGADFDLDELLVDSDVPLEEEEVEIEGAEEIPDWLAAARPVEGEEGVSAVNIARRRDEIPLDELTDRLQTLRERTREARDAEPKEMAVERSSAAEVLPGAGDSLSAIALFEEPGGRQVMLDVTLDKAQESRVSTLASLLGLDALSEAAVDEDGQPIPVDEAREAARIREAAQRARARSRRKPGRILVSLLLALAVVLPFFVDLSLLVDLPEAVLRPEVHGTIDVEIQNLSPGDMVLVGFEYGPTVAGELDPLAEVLLTHILLRGAKPVVVSTNPAGVLHAREVLARLAEDEFLLAHIGHPANAPLTMPEDYVILPYLPGGVVGLRSLTATSVDVNALDRGIFAVDLEGNPTGLDFRLLQMAFPLALTIAETGEDVRLWVEQVHEAVDIPIGAAVTGAAEPIARPYFDSGQLIGLLAGYRDAYIYDTVLLAALPPVRSLPEDGRVRPRNPFAGGDSAGLVPSEDGDVPAATPVPVQLAQGLMTNTPMPSLTPSPTWTPSPMPSATESPTETPVPSDQDLTATALASGTPSVAPSATPREFITATPVPEDGEVIEATPTPTRVFNGELLEPDRTYRDERWYSTMLGALVATALIGLGGIVNIVQWIRRRQDQ